MPRILLRYDMRAPAYGAPAPAFYAAALEQAAFGDAHGFASVQLSEHHGSDDGYLPSPLVLAAAIAGRTKQIRLEIAALILPLHDPLRVAEDVAVLDLAIGAGYVPAEFEMIERAIAERPRLVEEGMQALVSAWTGEPFDYRGRTVRVTPRPLQRPRPSLALGGSSPVTPDAGVALAEEVGPNGTLLLHPLMGGLPPELGWSSLELFAKSVLPRIRAHAAGVPSAGGRG